MKPTSSKSSPSFHFVQFNNWTKPKSISSVKKVSLVTHIDFWREGGGDKTRILALISYLSQRSELTIIYGGVEEPLDEMQLKALQLDFSLVYLERYRHLDIWEYAQLFNSLLLKESYDVCIVEYVGLSFLLDFIPPNIKTILDTHDIASEREKSFRQFGLEIKDMSWEEEVASFKKFDTVISIKPADYDRISREIGKDKTILASHPTSFSKQKIRKKVKSIGFLGGEHAPNQDAIKWFLKHVWPVVYQEGLSLDIFGRVGNCLANKSLLGVKLYGFVPNLDSIYKQVDIVINPVRFGAGIKIKNIEAIGNGLPLITTSHGAMGLESGAGSAFLVTDNPIEFQDQLLRLIRHYSDRKSLSETAYRFANDNFSVSKCFQPLLDIIYSSETN